MKKKNKEKGITLIALVVTIIVLLILAAVSIAMLTGENGILTQAKLAREKTIESQIKEELEMAIQSLIINNMGKEPIKEYIFNNEEMLKDMLDKDAILNKDESSIKYDDYKFKVKDDGSIELMNGITLNKDKMLMQIINEINAEETLIATVTNINGNIEWTSSNNQVATVDRSGKVTAIGDGNTIITAKCNEYSATCEVTVKRVNAMTSLNLNKTTARIGLGYSIELIATRNTNETEIVIWESADNTIAKVTSKGDNIAEVSGVSLGETTITAKNQAGTITAVCNIKVLKTKVLEEFNVFTDVTNSGKTLEQYGIKKVSQSNLETLHYSINKLGAYAGSVNNDFNVVFELDFSIYNDVILSAKELYTDYILRADVTNSWVQGITTIFYTDGTSQTESIGDRNSITNTATSYPITLMIQDKEIRSIQFKLNGHDAQFGSAEGYLKEIILKDLIVIDNE